MSCLVLYYQRGGKASRETRAPRFCFCGAAPAEQREKGRNKKLTCRPARKKTQKHRARTFAALGISYSGAEAKLDLLDRAGKYSNGFCHWPQPVYRKADGTFVTSKTDFTSLAVPSDKGSGFTALTTLMHEGGHAAHYANIDQASPFCSQERPPFSVALAEVSFLLFVFKSLVLFVPFSDSHPPTSTTTHTHTRTHTKPKKRRPKP